MDRAPVFSAIKTLRQGQAFTNAEVSAIDTLLDTLGIARAAAGGAAEVQIGLTLADFNAAATSLGCTSAQIRAVWEVESGGGWFKDVRADILALDGAGGFLDGPHLPKILFEAHVFDRYTEGRYRDSHPNLSSRAWNRKLYVGGQGEYVRLWKAMQLDRHAALLSASVGGAQIMGFNHKLAGFDTVEAFWDAMNSRRRRTSRPLSASSRAASWSTRSRRSATARMTVSPSPKAIMASFITRTIITGRSRGRMPDMHEPGALQ